MSQIINGMIEDDWDMEEPLPIAQVNKAVMLKILTFCKHVRECGQEPVIEQPLPSNDLTKHVEAWYAEYIIQDVDQALLFDLALAANYLNIKPLLKLASARIAALIKGKPIEEIRAFFKMENDFTPEEEERVREEN